jgi:hypothetical protein
MASDGKWYPPELHPSATTAPAVPDARAVPPTPEAGTPQPGSVPSVASTAPAAEAGPTTVPELAGDAGGPGSEATAVPHLSRWSDTSKVAAAASRPAAAGATGASQPPDILAQAMGGAVGAADLVSAAQDAASPGPVAMIPVPVTNDPGASGTGGAPGVGEFTGASARRRRIRWR